MQGAVEIGRESGDVVGLVEPGEVDIGERLAAMRLEMFQAAENLEFEKAARLRDELKRLDYEALKVRFVEKSLKP